MKRTREMALLAIFSGLIVALSFIPYTGYIEYGGISITTIHIPVFIISIVLGYKAGAIVGGVWGAVCLIKAFLEPTIWNIPFQNPLVSFVPRLIVGFLAGFIFFLLTRKSEKGLVFKMGFTFLITTIIHTALVITLLFLIPNEVYSVNELKDLLAIIFTVNLLIEASLATIVGTLVSLRLRKAYKRYESIS